MGYCEHSGDGETEGLMAGAVVVVELFCEWCRGSRDQDCVYHLWHVVEHLAWSCQVKALLESGNHYEVQAAVVAQFLPSSSPLVIIVDDALKVSATTKCIICDGDWSLCRCLTC